MTKPYLRQDELQPQLLVLDDFAPLQTALVQRLEVQVVEVDGLDVRFFFFELHLVLVVLRADDVAGLDELTVRSGLRLSGCQVRVSSTRRTCSCGGRTA